MKFRPSIESEPIEISLDECISLVKRGEVHPKALVYGEIVTDNKWLTADNLRIFHKNSPKTYPYGEYFAEKIRNEERKEEQRKRIGRLHFEYSEGNLIEDSYQLASLSELASMSGVLGVSRLFMLPSFEPEEIYTIIFRLDALKIEVAKGRTQLGASLPHLISRTAADGLWQVSSGESFHPSQVQKKSITLHIQHAPQLFRSWDTFLFEAKKATACSPTARLVLDGVGYRHKVQDRRVTIDVSWSNPSKEENPLQIALIQAYNDCTRVAKSTNLPIS